MGPALLQEATLLISLLVKQKKVVPLPVWEHPNWRRDGRQRQEKLTLFFLSDDEEISVTSIFLKYYM